MNSALRQSSEKAGRKENRMSKRTPNQPICVQFAYLDLNDKIAVNDFIEEANAQLNIDFEIKQEWQKEILAVLDAWHLGEIKTRGLDEWIQEKRPQNSLVCTVNDLGEEIYVINVENVTLLGLFVREMVELMTSGKEIRQCEASDCKKYFIPTPRGRNQEYCSKTCYHRIRKRIERLQKR